MKRIAINHVIFIIGSILAGCSSDAPEVADEESHPTLKIEAPHPLTVEEINSLISPPKNKNTPPGHLVLKGLRTSLGKAKASTFRIILIADDRLNLWMGPSVTNGVWSFAGHGGQLEMQIESILDKSGISVLNSKTNSNKLVGFHKQDGILRGKRNCLLNRELQPGEEVVIKGVITLALPINWETYKINAIEEISSLQESKFLSSVETHPNDPSYWMMNVEEDYRGAVTVVEHLFDKQGTLIKPKYQSDAGPSSSLSLPAKLESISESYLYISGGKEIREIPFEIILVPFS